MALVHVGLVHRATAAGLVDDLGQQGRQTEVAADLQAPAGEQLFDVGAARHDPQQVLLRDLDSDIRSRMTARLGARLRARFGPERQLGAEHELENAFDTDGTGIGEQPGQQRL
ncbi:hypothetical protein D9M71_780550 [compost metagenome]